MAEIQPMLIFTASYLAIYFLLIGMMPIFAPNLLYGGRLAGSFEVPENFSTWDIENIKYYKENNLTFPQPAIYYDYTADINVKLYAEWTVFNPYISLDVITWEWWIFSTSEDMYFKDMEGGIYVNNLMYLGKPELEDTWNTEFNSSILTAQATGIIKVKCWFMDTNTTRNDIGEAFDEGKVTLAVGFGMDDIETAYSAFTLVGLLLTFASPEIFGATGIIAVTLNLIANSPVYVAIAYLIYYFITSIIPFIRGA